MADHRQTGIGRRAVYWLVPRWRDSGWWAFALNRFSGLVLVGYLAAHFVVLSLLVQGADGWNRLVEIFGSTPFLVGDVLLVAAVVFHGLNGLRVIGLTLGQGTARPVIGVVAVLAASAVLVAIAGWAILLS